MSRLPFIALVLVTSSSVTAAQVSPATPPKVGSIQRAAILNTIRPAVEARLRTHVEFVPTCVRVWNGWAFVDAEPQAKGGRPLRPETLPDWEYRDGLTVTALLRFRYGRWNLIEHAIGATDAWYDGQAPRALFRTRCH